MKKYYLVEGSEALLQNHNLTLRFGDFIQGTMPENVVVEMVTLDNVTQTLHECIERSKGALKDDNVFVISLHPVYFPDAEYQIHCNRIIDTDGNSLGVGPRPGCKSIKSQVSAAMHKANGRKIVVVDDTLFHGDTINTLLDNGLQVDVVVEFFALRDPMDKLEKDGVVVVTGGVLTDWVDVLPIHDFLPGFPLCGKVVGKEEHGEYRAKFDGIWGSVAIPYLEPFATSENVKLWSSVPVEHTAEFSVFAHEETLKFIEEHGDPRKLFEESQLRISRPVGMEDGEDLETLLRRNLHLVETKIANTVKS